MRHASLTALSLLLLISAAVTAGWPTDPTTDSSDWSLPPILGPAVQSSSSSSSSNGSRWPPVSAPPATGTLQPGSGNQLAAPQVVITPGVPNKRAARAEILYPPVAYLENPVSGPLPQVNTFFLNMSLCIIVKFSAFSCDGPLQVLTISFLRWVCCVL